MGARQTTYSTAIVLQAIAQGHRYGFDIMDVTGLPSGTVYPALRRLERDGLLESKWEEEEEARNDGRPVRRYYAISGVGAAALTDALGRFPGLIRVVPPAGEDAETAPA